MDTLYKLEKTIAKRKEENTPGSYTCYLFEKGIDKILKKVGEESAEVIIAAKNKIKADTLNESADLFYHLLVMFNEQGIKLDEVLEVLEERSKG